MTANYYQLALAAAGTCHAGEEVEFFGRVRNLAVRIHKEESKMSDFFTALERAENGGEKNGNKGWGKFNASIIAAELNPKMANRAFITYSYMGKEELEDGTLGEEKLLTDTIRTVPTADPDGQALYIQAQALVGHDVIIYKRPDPDFDSAKANKGRPANKQVGAPKTVFFIEDLGSSTQTQAHAPAQRQQRPAQIQAQAPAPQSQNTSAPAHNAGANAAKTQLFNQLKAATPGAPDQVLKIAAAAGWAAIGNPIQAPTPESINTAYGVAMGEVQKAAAAAVAGNQ